MYNNEDYTSIKRMIPLALADYEAVTYYETDTGMGFVAATDSQSTFRIAKLEFEDTDKDPRPLFNLCVFIEKDMLWFHIGNHLTMDFEFGLNDLNVLQDSLYNHNTFNFTVVHKGDQIEFTTKTFSLSDKQKEVIKSFVLETYPKETNLKDKYGEYMPFETLRESQMSAIEEIIKGNMIGNKDDLRNYIAEKYKIDDIDVSNKSLMNEILEYAIERFSINCTPVGYCILNKTKL